MSQATPDDDGNGGRMADGFDLIEQINEIRALLNQAVEQFDQGCVLTQD